jgi:hypothetical protein
MFYQFFNTTSNIVFINVGLAGMYMRLNRSLPWYFAAADIMIIIVGIGSAIFHGTQTYIGQLLDELPMSILGCFHVMVLRGSHWVLSYPYELPVLVGVHLVVAAAWAAYLAYYMYDIFVLTFTGQVIFSSFTALAAGPPPLLSGPRRLWWLAIGAIVVGKGCWEYERNLYRAGNCPSDPYDPRFWLHPVWHLGAALSHYFFMAYAEELRKGSLARSKASSTNALIAEADHA